MKVSSEFSNSGWEEMTALSQHGKTKIFRQIKLCVELRRNFLTSRRSFKWSSLKTIPPPSPCLFFCVNFFVVIFLKKLLWFFFSEKNNLAAIIIGKNQWQISPKKNETLFFASWKTIQNNNEQKKSVTLKRVKRPTKILSDFEKKKRGDRLERFRGRYSFFIQ